MIPHQAYFPLNWQDGMKISSGHFQAWDSAIQDQIRDTLASQLGAHQFGLILPAPGHSQSLDLRLQQGELILNECRAITRGGIRIEISQSNSFTSALKKSISNIPHQSDLYAVIIVVDPFQRESVGTPDQEEIPPRLPYTIPSYRLELLPLDHAHPNMLLSQLIIGKLQINGLQAELLPYIPPCCCIEAENKMKGHLVDFSNHLYQILVHCSEIVKKVQAKQQQKSLAKNISFISEKTAFYIAERIDTLKHQGPYLSPIHLFSQIQGLARILDVAGVCLPEQERDDVFKFFSEFLNTRLGEWNQTVKSVLNLTYDHSDILTNMIIPQGNFLAITERLFHQLAELDELDWKKREIHRIKVEDPNYFEVTNNRTKGTKIKPRNKR